MTDHALTPSSAVWIGHGRVSLPVLALVGVGALLGWLLTGKGAGTVLGFVLAGVPGWLWWSYSVPRWRDWIEDNNISEASIYDLAVGTCLVFHRGSFFEATEFRRRDGSRGWRRTGTA